MKKLITLALITVTLFLLNCSGEKHFITDSVYRKKVNQQFESRREMAHSRYNALFSVFDKSLSLEQEEALKFLYAYMPLSDLADYDGEYYLQQIDLSLMARDTFSWGKDIPEDIFRHFVLPVRINNENLDTARVVIFNELKNRVRNLSMTDAALEVNHWCHEKVNYRASDARTSSPLASMRTSFGRCGEESTFTVSAMRSVGIPARQVYTPRWAHTDDNHAWVEVFVEGKWQYLGACEPEAVLNKGWFDVPVKRAMMVHTNVIGAYKGNENVLEQNDLYTKINSLSSYAITKPLAVMVINEEGKPVPDARVEFRIYNYAEFYPMVVKQSDENGMAVVQTGLGDLQIWASKNDIYGYSKVSIALVDTLTVKLNRRAGETYSEIVDIVPPVEKLVESVPVDRQEENSRRLVLEDSIRNAYMATFMKPEQAEYMAIMYGLDTARVKRLIALSYGNWREISTFIKGNSKNPMVLDLLGSISEKDLRDTPAKYLSDHLSLINYVNDTIDIAANKIQIKDNTGIDDLPFDNEIFKEGILSPRISNELIRPWRTYLRESLKPIFEGEGGEDTQTLSMIKGWVRDSITLNTTENYMGCPISPIGVYQIRIADKLSRDIFFVAFCRTFNIPARINQATQMPQVYKEGGWVNVTFEDSEAPVKSAQLVLLNGEGNAIKPEYYIHYTIQKYNNGYFTTLDYEGSSLVTEFPVTLDLEPGYYLLMTGHRRDDGSVLSGTNYFTLKKGDKLSKTVLLQPLEQTRTIAGIIDLRFLVTDMTGKRKTLAELSGNKGIILSFINPANEPTRHIMSDIPLLTADFNKWGGHFLFIVPSSIIPKDYNPVNYKNLPQATIFMEDAGDKLLKAITKSVGLPASPNYPLVVFITPKGEITFLSTGYRIGIGENLLKASRTL